MNGCVGCAQYKGAQLKGQLIPGLFSNQAEHPGAGYTDSKERWPFYSLFVPKCTVF